MQITVLYRLPYLQYFVMTGLHIHHKINCRVICGNVTASRATKMTSLYYPAKMFNIGSSLQIGLLIINIFWVELGQSESCCVEGCVNEGSPIPAWSLKSLLNAQNKV